MCLCVISEFSFRWLLILHLLKWDWRDAGMPTYVQKAQECYTWPCPSDHSRVEAFSDVGYCSQHNVDSSIFTFQELKLHFCSCMFFMMPHQSLRHCCTWNADSFSCRHSQGCDQRLGEILLAEWRGRPGRILRNSLSCSEIVGWRGELGVHIRSANLDQSVP